MVQGAEQIEALLAAELSRPLNVWLKLDSGMHRLGLAPAAVRELFPRLRAAAQVAELNLLSHFACADERGHSLTEVQLECFLDLLDTDFDQRSLANSAAVLMIPAAHMDWLRPGIMLYGASPFADLSAAELGLKPAMTLSAQLIAVREVAVGRVSVMAPAGSLSGRRVSAPSAAAMPTAIRGMRRAVRRCMSVVVAPRWPGAYQWTCSASI